MPRLRVAGVVLAIASVSFAGCKEVETETATSYEPAHLEEVKGNPDVKRVTFTREGAQRTGLKTAAVRREGRREVVPYESLIYDAEGKAYVYTNPKPLTFLRVPVQVDRIEGNRVVLTKGPAPRTAVVTVGAAEVYGTELEIAGSH
jgi:hypothetical protein